MRNETNIQQQTFDGSGRSALNDQNLVTEAKGGDSEAFAVLCERHRSGMLRAAYRITRALEDAEDAIQESFLNAFVHLKSFDGRSSFATWLTRIVVNASYMILRKRARRGREIPVENPLEPDEKSMHIQLVDHRDDPEKECIASERLQMTQAGIDRLPRIFKSAIALRMSGCSMKEIAQAEGISEKAAKSRLLRAKRALCNALTMQGVLPTDSLTRDLACSAAAHG